MKKEPKFLRIMRISTFLLFLCVFAAFATNTNSQNARVNINRNNLTISEFIDQVEKQTDYLFVYSKSELNVNENISVHAGKKTVAQCLNEAFNDSDVRYAFENDYIVLTKKTSPVIVQQGRSVSGVVYDSSGETIIGANIVVKGTTNGIITDIDGKFSLMNVPEGATLVVSYIGFESIEVNLGNKTSVTITLKDDTQALDEVVVVGYGVQRKSDVTGSISVVTADEILANPAFNALQGLKGKAAGVNIFNGTGNPAGVSESGPRVVIRGMNSINTTSDPLYVVDGVQMNEFHYINPNDIERMEVLKDASATAIYGARGANGVILVTTKRGNAGGEGKTVVSYSGYVSMGQMAKKVDLLDSEEFMKVQDIAFANFGKYEQSKKYVGTLVDRSDPMLFDANGNPLYNTDWQEEATRDAWSHSHQLNVQNQGKNSSVGAFFNYTDEQGIMLNNYAKRLNAKITYDAKPTRWLDISSNVMVNHTWMNGIDDTGGGQVARRTMWEMPSIFPVKFPDGSWSNSQFEGNKLNFGLEAMSNPVHELETRKRNRYRTKIFGNLGFTFHLLDGLDLRTQIGVDGNLRSNKDYDPTDLINISSPRGRASMYHGERLYWQEETYLSYNKVLNGIHRLNATLGMSWSKYTETSSNTGTVRDFDSDFYGYDNLEVGLTATSQPTSEWKQWAMNSYFGRVSYGLKDKYLLTATLRVDGSSRFGKNNKYGTFPSAGLGWIMSHEDFMKGTATWLDNFKIHTSYGRTGNTEIDPYRSLALIEAKTTLINGSRGATGQMNRMPNPDLEWEKTDQFDVGINLNMFRNRVNLELDYYYKITDDLLLERPLPFTTGFSSVWENMGRVDNSGIDFLLNTINIDTKDFTWESTLNLNYNKNEIKRLGENNEDIITNPGFVGGNIILRVGESLSSFYGYERLGVWGTDEAEEAAKVNAVPGEAKRSKERTIIGNGLPNLTGSFINKFYYKNFDLIVDLQFVTGVDAWQLFFHSAEDRTGIANGLSTILYDGWTETNQNTMVQQIRQQNYSGQNSTSDSHWVADGSYLRGSLLQLGYTFDNKLISKWKMQNMRVNFSVSNAFLIHSKKFKGYDPEATSNTDKFGQNVFFYQYPVPRTYTLGVNLSF